MRQENYIRTDRNGTQYFEVIETCEIKEELKVKGAKFDFILLWHFKDKVKGYDLLEIDINEFSYINVYGEYSRDVKLNNKIKEKITEANKRVG